MLTQLKQFLKISMDDPTLDANGNTAVPAQVRKEILETKLRGLSLDLEASTEKFFIGEGTEKRGQEPKAVLMF